MRGCWECAVGLPFVGRQDLTQHGALVKMLPALMGCISLCHCAILLRCWWHVSSGERMPPPL